MCVKLTSNDVSLAIIFVILGASGFVFGKELAIGVPSTAFESSVFLLVS